jgi:hypothetical protein
MWAAVAAGSDGSPPNQPLTLFLTAAGSGGNRPSSQVPDGDFPVGCFTVGSGAMMAMIDAVARTPVF